jgi:hypothetical protein
MALAGTTVVETLSGGRSQVLAEPGMPFEAGQTRSADKSRAAATTKYATMGRGVAALVMI